MADLDIVVVNYKRDDLVYNFFSSLEDNMPERSFTATVVHNGSSNDGRDFIDSLSGSFLPLDPTQVFLGDNVGYARACNIGASYGDSKYIGIFNNDVWFNNSDCIDICLDFMDSNPDVGVVGPKQIDSRNRITHAGIIGPPERPSHRGWHEPNNGEKYSFNEEVLSVIGAAMFVRRDAWNAAMNDDIFRKHWPDALGAMAETFLYFEETSLNYMMPRLGYKVCYVGEAVCVHEWHKTISQHGDKNVFFESQERFRNMMDDMGIKHD